MIKANCQWCGQETEGRFCDKYCAKSHRDKKRVSRQTSEWKYRPCIDCGELTMGPNDGRCERCKKEHWMSRAKR